MAATTLAIVLWAAYLFTAIGLRVRTVRELAQQAEPLPEVTRIDQIQNGEADDQRGLWANLLWKFETRSHRTLDRLESLQRPSVATITRHLLGRDEDEPAAQIQRVQSIAFSPDGQVLASRGSNTATVLWNAETRLNISSVPGTVNSGQAIAKIVLWEPAMDIQCFSATDSHGEKLLIVTRPLPRPATDEQSNDYDYPPPRELLLIDMAGRIFARQSCPGGGLVGKLAEPHGQADQLVFGTKANLGDRNGTVALRVVGPGVICIVDDGGLKTVRLIPSQTSAPNEIQSVAPPEE
jgi:hypothetical protein